MDDAGAPLAAAEDDASYDGDAGTGPARAQGSRPAQTAALLPPSKRSQVKKPHDSRAEDAIGRVLGSYKLLEVIGRGGMGRVYRAEHTRLGRQVALKLLRPEYAVKRDAVARFFQEAKAVNKIRHRNIVEVTDYVELDDGTTFIIMELLEGASLGKALRTSGPMDPARLLSILVQVCDGLEAAHAVGIVHRDLKPDNIFLVDEDAGEHAKLLDFGVAKLVAAGDEDSADLGWQTAAGSVVGTPAYMSPEQAGGLDIDGRSDVYSLGAIMYELFCGQPLFRGRSFGDFVVKHMSESPLPPRATPGGAAMAVELEQIILRCLAKNPGARYQSVGELRDRLYQHLCVLDSGVAALRDSRTSGQRSLASASGQRRAGYSSAPLVIDPMASMAGLPGLPPTPPPSRITELASPLDLGTDPALDAEPEAEIPSSNGLDTRLVLGDLRVTPTPAATRKRRATWPLWTAGAAALALGAFLLATGVGREPAGTSSSYSGATAPAPTVPTPTPAPNEPLVEPLVVPVAATPPERKLPGRVKLAIRTDPVGADVFVYGSDDSQCKTPCELTIDLGDGGSTRKRVFTLKRAGFRDYQLDVPLEGAPPQDAFVILMPENDEEPKPAVEPTPPPPRSKGTDERKRERGERASDEKAAPKPKDDLEDAFKDAPVTKPPPVEPAKTEPPAAKKKDKIDRADTLDPFGKK